MKKTLLTLAIMLLGLGAAKAADITENWAEATWAPADYSTTATPYTSTSTNIEYTFYKAKKMTGAIILTGNTTTGGYISFSLPINCSEIQITTPKSGASTSTSNRVTIYVGDNVICKQTTINSPATTYKFPIPAEYRKAGTVYKIISNSSRNSQFATTTYIEESAEPTLSILQNEVEYAVPLNSSQTNIVKGTAENISENISVSVDNAAFAISATSVTAAELTEGIEVTYTGSTAGETTATLTFTAGSLTKTVALSGVTAENEGTEANPLSVADVIAMKNLNPGPFYVTGIISDKCAANATNGKLNESDNIVDTNIVLKDENGNMIPVTYTNNSEAKKALNIKDNPTNAGQKVIIEGNLETYFSVPGVKNATYISGLSTSGIADIVADENAPVEYFNLQGIRVDNPENGLYIRRQGNKVTKVIVK